MVTRDGEYVDVVGLTSEEELIVEKFLHANVNENRSLADIIMEKIKEKRTSRENQDNNENQAGPQLSPKVYNLALLVIILIIFIDNLDC